METTYTEMIVLSVAFLIGIYTAVGEPATYIGCYDNRALTQPVTRYDNLNAIKRCTIFCQGYLYAGTQGTKCSCGNKLSEEYAVAKKCYVECPGNKTQICGGLYKQMSFYRVLGKPTTLPTERTHELSTITTEKTTTRTTSRTTSGKTASLRTETKVNADTTIPERNTSTEESIKPSSGNTSGDELQIKLALYISLPVTVAIAGISVTVIVLISRRKGQQKNPEDSHCVNYSRTASGTVKEEIEDFDNDAVYDECDPGYRTSYLTPVMSNYLTPLSPDNSQYKTPYVSSSQRLARSSDIPAENGSDGYYSKTYGLDEIGLSQYERILPNSQLRGNDYEQLRK